MTFRDEVLRLIRARPGISDAEIVRALPGGSSRHQQVNQRCRQLMDQGLIVREKRGQGPIGNYPSDEDAEGNARLQAEAERPPGVLEARLWRDEASVPTSDRVAAPRAEVSVSMRWHSAGEIAPDASSLPMFPKLASVPGIYRFRFTSERSVYVGEAVDLRRRMQNYRTPGASQTTSIWVGETIRASLARKEIILLDTCTDVILSVAGNDRPADLGSKTTRLFVESAALIGEAETGWTILNRAN